MISDIFVNVNIWSTHNQRIIEMEETSRVIHFNFLHNARNSQEVGTMLFNRAHSKESILRTTALQHSPMQSYSILIPLCILSV